MWYCSFYVGEKITLMIMFYYDLAYNIWTNLPREHFPHLFTLFTQCFSLANQWIKDGKSCSALAWGEKHCCVPKTETYIDPLYLKFQVLVSSMLTPSQQALSFGTESVAIQLGCCPRVSLSILGQEWEEKRSYYWLWLIELVCFIFLHLLNWFRI